MRLQIIAGLGLLLAACASRADEKLPFLTAGSVVYSNVTVTKVTATDVFFMHARGVGNAKLKDLDPESQKRFRYDPAKASEAAKKQSEANLEYRRQLAAQKPPPPPTPEAEAEPKPVGDEVEIKVPKLYARSFLGQTAPRLVVEKWLTETPITAEKFVLVDFWATWCGPCRQSIPHLNALHAKFKDRLVIIGLSDESERDVRAMKSPKIDYPVAIDPHGRMERAVEVKGIPHAMLIDPKGIVRFEGMPSYLTERGLERLLEKHSR
jgi:thiol-disulfide isomerase/thioredoxin